MGRSNDVDGMFEFSSNMAKSVSNTVFQPASLPGIAYDAYFMPERYAIVSEKGITLLDPDE